MFMINNPGIPTKTDALIKAEVALWMGACPVETLSIFDRVSGDQLQKILSNPDSWEIDFFGTEKELRDELETLQEEDTDYYTLTPTADQAAFCCVVTAIAPESDFADVTIFYLEDGSFCGAYLNID